MKMKLWLMSLGVAFATVGSASAQQDGLLEILRSELKEQYSKLQKEEFPPYQMSYRVIDRTTWGVSASFGAVMGKSHFRQSTMIPQIRIGDREFDNFKNRSMGSGDGSVALLPVDVENNADAVRQAIWDQTNARYRFAVNAFQNDKAKKNVNVASEDKAPCYSDAKIEKYYEAPVTGELATFDNDQWGTRLEEISAVFNSDPNILNGSASVSYLLERRYFVDNEGREVVQNLTYARLMVQGVTKADDGMEMPLFLSYFAYNPKDLPSQEKVLADTKKLTETLGALRTAPIVDPFTGPALLSGGAAGVFFHEIFGHRIEGLRMKSDSDGQTFKKMMGQLVLPASLSVCDDPTLTKYGEEDLNGYYKFDDEGIRAERVQVVKDGKLQEFLMTRTPIDEHPRSNGHARAEKGLDAVSRQSNLIIETSDFKSDSELRKLLIDEAKRQGKECGYFFKEVTGGLTFTGKQSISSFNVTPLEVYRVYVDGRPDQLVRGVDLIGTPLSMFSNIIYAGGKMQIFTGMCGAESGSIPVTAIAPTMLVNKVEVQRKDKSQDIPPILPRP